MQQVFINLQKVLLHVPSLCFTLVGIVFIGGISYYFTDSVQIIGNLGKDFLIFQIIIDSLIAMLFGLFLGASMYKILYFKKASSKKDISTGIFGGVIGVLVGGCPLCSITLASYLGLAGILGVLPYSGIELKILSFIILIYALISTLRNLEVCKLKI